jgi:hypothetical protein
MEQLDASQDSVTDAPEEVVSTDTSTSPDDPVEADSETEAQLDSAPEEDDEEIDYDGEKYKVPKKLREAFLRQQDYTQKTQAVAEQRREVEARQQYLAQQAQIQQQHIAEFAEVHNLNSQLQQYAQIDWNALIDSDPVQAMKLDRQMKELQQRRDYIAQSVHTKQQQAQLEMQRENAKRIQEGQAVLSREVNGWSPEVAKSLREFGKEVGFSEEELAHVNDPRAVKLLHRAWQLDQLMKKQAVPKDKPAPQEKPPVRITATKGTAAKDPSNMSDKEFAQWRKRQIAQR